MRMFAPCECLYNCIDLTPCECDLKAAAGRLYSLQYSADLMHSNTWHDVEGQVDLPGADGPLDFTPPALPAGALFRVHTRLAE